MFNRKRAPDPRDAGLAEIDAGLQQIAEWHAWFVSAHTARLAELNLPSEQHDRELADALKAGAAVAERMKTDFLARSNRP